MSGKGQLFDVAVIGGGSAGYAAARTTAAASLRTVVIDGAEELGGLCILRGCMPTKALLYAAEVAHLARHAATWGISTEGLRIDFQKVMARKDALVREFADHRRHQLTDGRFDLIRAMGRFVDPHTLELSNGQTVRASHFVISTGSRVAPAPLPQLEAVGYLTSDTALKLERLPASLIVLGGGAVALEFAQFFARMGVKIILVQRSPHVLHEFDADAAAAIENVFRREGMEVYTGTQLLDAWREGAAKGVTFLQASRKVRVTADEIFFGLGRQPNTGGLRLENAGLVAQGGRLRTDLAMRTDQPHIFAAGDCTSPNEIVHLAVLQGETAGYNAAHPASPPRHMDYRLLTEVVFTDPQMAVVGLTEKRARADNIPYLAASYPFSDHGKSIIMEAKEGFVKLLAHAQTGEIIGGACVGPAGGELIHEVVAAMAKRMTVRELAAMPHYHPTLAEIWTYPAEELSEKIASVR